MVRRRAINPFYPIVVVTGVLFCITAFAYGVMMVRQLREAGGLHSAERPEGFTELIDKYGVLLMTGELVALGLSTVAAMATDRLFSRRIHSLKVNDNAKESEEPRSDTHPHE